MTLVASRGRMKVVVMVVVLIGLWFTLVQYDNTCTLGRKEELSRNMAGFSKGLGELSRCAQITIWIVF